MGTRELAIGEVERWVVCHRLVQQTYCLPYMFNLACVESCLSQELLAPKVAIIRNEVGCGWLLDDRFLCWRKFRLKLVGNCFRNLALDGKNVIERAMIIFRPQVRVGPGVDHLRADPDTISGTLYVPFQNVSDTQATDDRAQIAYRPAIL